MIACLPWAQRAGLITQAGAMNRWGQARGHQGSLQGSDKHGVGWWGWLGWGQHRACCACWDLACPCWLCRDSISLQAASRKSPVNLAENEHSRSEDGRQPLPLLPPGPHRPHLPHRALLRTAPSRRPLRTLPRPASLRLWEHCPTQERESLRWHRGGSRRWWAPASPPLWLLPV